MHPSHHAITQPNKPALIFEPSGDTLTYLGLEQRVTQAAHLLIKLGVRRGDAIAFCIENCAAFFELAWAAQRVGAVFTPMSTKLSIDDVCYIAEDSDARIVVLSAACESARYFNEKLLNNAKVLSVGGHIDGCAEWETLRQEMPTAAIPDSAPGREMMYSSGTTGRPKGVRKPMPSGKFDDPDLRNVNLGRAFQLSGETVFLSTSPLYHSAPYRNAAAALSFGATCIVMERFDAELALHCIDAYRCTHGIWVPTMFHRLLGLPSEIKAKYDVRSLKCAGHGAAPCAIHVKEKIIAWWGPILHEYYAGTEGIGACMISSEEWLRRKGSVGRATDGEIHILDEHGDEVAAGVTGNIYFKNTSKFEYWKAPEKTAGSRSRQGWWTYGDIGHVDPDGYLYLTDRKDFMIIAGGVNIYPQEIENVLLSHPKVADVAVFGVPNEEFGEEVKAVVQPVAELATCTDADKAELIEFCRNKLGSVKMPRSIDFSRELPRHATGKLYKRVLRDQYRQAAQDNGDVLFKSS